MNEIKVFLVEDEMVIRRGIKNSIDWEKEGYIFCGEASDGELAYPMIIKEKPDILITDINMPYVNGVELLKKVHTEYPEMITFVISGYDDFEYVKVLEGEKQNTVEYGDLFFTTSSETPQAVGMSSVYLGENIKLYLNSFCFGFRFDNFHIILPEFAAYYFRGNFVKRILYKLAQGSTRYNLPISDFLGERICVPPSTDEQQAIFNLLSSCDKEIDLLKKELQEWENKKQTYTKLLISGIVRV